MSALALVQAGAPQRSGVVLSDEQGTALASILEFARGVHGARVMTLEGYAGTGKTTLVAELVMALHREMSIAIAAPTNKAVGVLREKIERAGQAFVDFGSIHSFLGLRLRERDDGSHECRQEGESTMHQFQLVVVDECSMIGRDLFARTIACDSTRVLFVGDPAQLPPVGELTRESPTFLVVAHKARLTKIARQAEGHPIIGLSKRIRDAQELGQRVSAGELAEWVPAPPADVLVAGGGGVTIYNWALHDVRAGLDTRILAYRNETVRRYNREIHNAIHGQATPFAVGETVMLNSAHEARQAGSSDPLRANKIPLRNSEEGVVVGIRRAPHPRHADVPAWELTLRTDTGIDVLLWFPLEYERLQAEISQRFTRAAQIKADLMSRPDSLRDHERRQLIGGAWELRNDFADVRHTYAMTVHKSQGSTIHTVIVDLDDIGRMRDPFDHNRALYVAVTRASHRLALVA